MGWKEDFEANLRRLWGDVDATSGWKTRSNGISWAQGHPVGCINHHLVVPAAPSYERPSVDMGINGYSGLPGPICNAVIASDGTVHLIAGEPANHAGMGRRDVLNRVMSNQAPRGDAADIYGSGSDDFNGNAWYFGAEYQHPGDSSPWPDIQLRAGFAWNAALLLTFDYPAERAIMHREHSYRKIDMSWHGDLRGSVRRVMQSGGTGDEFDKATADQVRAAVLAGLAN